MLLLLEAEPDYGRLVYVTILCGLCFWIIVFPVGRMLENFTKERVVRYIWTIVMAIAGVFIFVSMGGVGKVIDYAVDLHIRKEASENPNTGHPEVPGQLP
ncbi:MAG: hypothetical protein KDB07_01290 [Planctomycetes bacterium]|nr:hypothetical protein [Planctomycetota bacterium]